MVGSVMAADLAADFDTTVADVSDANLRQASARAAGRIKTVRADLSDARVVADLVKPYDIVCGALASRLGFATLRTVIEAGKNYCDISFFAEDALQLDALAKARGVTAIVDCGVAPGMSNMAAGFAAAHFDRGEHLAIYVGGLPRERRWPFEYKAGFAPGDVVEEYTRPSRIVDRGEVVVREALSEPELLDFPGVGTLEAFNTDGLRSLAVTLRADSAGRGFHTMVEKTLRYPGHIELMRVLRHTGLFSKEPIDLLDEQGRTVRVRPLDVISKLMFPLWTYQPGEEDLTVMRIEAVGVRAGRRERLTWDLFDLFDRGANATSMSRTTAFPCAIMARLVASGEFSRPGVVPPEFIGQTPGLLDRVLADLDRRGIHYTAHTHALPAR